MGGKCTLVKIASLILVKSLLISLVTRKLDLGLSAHIVLPLTLTTPK